MPLVTGTLEMIANNFVRWIDELEIGGQPFKIEDC